MSNQDPGPRPEDAPGLDAGGGVQPGDTPPDAGQTSGLSHPQPNPSRVMPVFADTERLGHRTTETPNGRARQGRPSAPT
ncbi:MAG: hypothetical protein DCC47_07035 [Acidobacteria bacterium]|nr:MAG: hypothetical protein DCC47_07035 [Acidobacteriota bacterium]